ncbi:TniQ family protein [Achromobacter kerstersii]
MGAVVVVVVRPVAGEFYLGHFARNWRINNHGATLLPSIARLSHGRVSKSYPNELLPYPNSGLARSLGISSESYWRAHTLQPLQFLTNFSTESATVEWAFSTTRLRVGCGYWTEEVVRYCAACVEEDKATLGFAYWRREHLVPGVDECFVHRSPLQILKREHRATAFIFAPGEDCVDLEDTPGGLNEAKSNVVVQRYLALVQSAIHAITLSPGRFLPFQTQAYGRPELGPNRDEFWLEDMLIKLRGAVPESWLKRHFPALAATGSRVNRSRGQCKRVQDLPGTAWLLLNACMAAHLNVGWGACAAY